MVMPFTFTQLCIDRGAAVWTVKIHWVHVLLSTSQVSAKWSKRKWGLKKRTVGTVKALQVTLVAEALRVLRRHQKIACGLQKSQHVSGWAEGTFQVIWYLTAYEISISGIYMDLNMPGSYVRSGQSGPHARQVQSEPLQSNLLSSPQWPTEMQQHVADLANSPYNSLPFVCSSLYPRGREILSFS